MSAKMIDRGLVRCAIYALICFCEKHQVVISDGTLLDFANAWRERGSFEWISSQKAFRAIVATPLHECASGKVIAFVYGNDSILDELLTKELNQEIFKVTNGEWLPE